MSVHRYIRRHHHLTLSVGGAQEDYDFHTKVLGLKSVTACGWPLRFSHCLSETPRPTHAELQVLRKLHARTAEAHRHA